MGKSKGTTTSTQQSLDPMTQGWIADIYNSARGASQTPGLGPDPRTMGAADLYSRYGNAGNLGMGALSGDPAAVAGFMNPYTDNVVNRVIGDQGRLNEGVMNSVNDYATKAGAFGGTRHGIATGTALADTARTGADQIAQLRSAGYDSAMGRAGQVANLGLSGAQGMAGMGDYLRKLQESNDPNMRRMSILREGLMGLPYGSSSMQTQKTQSNGWNTALGGLGVLGSLFMPGGAGLGALGGLFGGGGIDFGAADNVNDALGQYARRMG